MAHPKPLPIRAGQESVWDYPRPPRLERISKAIRVDFAGEVLAQSTRAYRVLETSHPPVYYIPPGDIDFDLLAISPQNPSNCEWKGRAQYLDAKVRNQESKNVGWRYLEPDESFMPIAGYVAFYADRVDACYVDGILATAQPGDFYGGWITPDVVGPFKGIPGSWGW